MKCLFCFNETGKIYFDKKNRPYFYDPLCGNRIFFRSPMALKAVLAWAKMASGITQQDFIALLNTVETGIVFRDSEIQKWVAGVETPAEIIRRDSVE